MVVFERSKRLFLFKSYPIDLNSESIKSDRNCTVQWAHIFFLFSQCFFFENKKKIENLSYQMFWKASVFSDMANKKKRKIIQFKMLFIPYQNMQRTITIHQYLPNFVFYLIIKLLEALKLGTLLFISEANENKKSVA